MKDRLVPLTMEQARFERFVASAGIGSEPMAYFTPGVHRYPELDWTIYLTEDVSYIANEIDTFLTLLWHSDEPRLVGIKLSTLAHFRAQVERKQKLHTRTRLGAIVEAVYEQIDPEVRNPLAVNSETAYRQAIAFLGETQIDF